MRKFAAVTALFALLSLPAAAGGKACQVAESAVPTPGLRAMAMGSSSEPMPDEARLTSAQIDILAEADTNFRRALQEIEERIKKFPAGKPGAVADLSGKALPELVTAFLSRSVRGRAFVIDPKTAGEFRLANDAAMAAWKNGEESKSCPLCIAVRVGLESSFRWEESEFGALTEAQKKELAELGKKRDDLGRKWAFVLKEELTVPQLEWLRNAQMRWLKATLKSSVTAGMKSLGAKTCGACAWKQEQEKCEFCVIVKKAVEAATEGVER